ncbi:histone-like nucleoid-structuring protein Lsr2 [Corynebacterium hindlerae]|uniref:histone-like nucleoid-structuring protein Lsr2 n=1 Tax=Corynebacterium hindlerae TaxID=699041 RepID=UPI003AAA5D90
MARREVIQFFDDLDNTPLTQEEVTIIKFAVNGTNYIIDLSEKNADKFHETLAPFIKAARKDTATSRRSNNSPDPKLVREWAATHGITVAARGKISQEIIQKYLDSH